MQERKKIIRNSFHCKKCGRDIESKSLHDFAACDCGNYTDGGKDYIKRGGHFSNIEDTSLFEDDKCKKQ